MTEATGDVELGADNMAHRRLGQLIFAAVLMGAAGITLIIFAVWAFRAERGCGAPLAGGADPDNARRSGPGPCDLRAAIGAPGVMLTVETSSRRAVSGALRRDRLRPVPGQPCAAAARVRRACVRRTRAKLPPRNGETRRSRPPAASHPPALLSLDCSRLFA